MARPKIDFKVENFQALREDARVQADITRRAKKIAEAAGGEEMGYIVRENLARDRRVGSTVLATGHAAWSNRAHQSLIHAISAGSE